MSPSVDTGAEIVATSNIENQPLDTTELETVARLAANQKLLSPTLTRRLLATIERLEGELAWAEKLLEDIYLWVLGLPIKQRIDKFLNRRKETVK